MFSLLDQAHFATEDSRITKTVYHHKNVKFLQVAPENYFLAKT